MFGCGVDDTAIGGIDGDSLEGTVEPRFLASGGNADLDVENTARSTMSFS